MNYVAKYFSAQLTAPKFLKFIGLFVLLIVSFGPSVFAQAFCNNPLGTLAPNLTWQYQSHSSLGYYSFNATAGCTYQFTYCNSVAPSASYSGDTYITISSGIVTGALTTNDDYCGLGSYLSWTAPSTGVFYFNVGNCCSPQCGAVATRTFGYRSTNCSGTTPAPTGISASSNTICSGQSVTLTALGAFGTQYWYTGSCGGSQIGTGATLTVSPNSTTTYYVNNNNAGQFGPSCASITITVNPSPAAPTVTGNTVFCGTASTTLTASGAANYAWYSDAAGTNQISSSSVFTTPQLNTTTTYYVASTTGGAVQLPTYTFTTCGATGRFGPSQTQINSSYSGTTLAGQVTSSAGIQLWTVPTTGTYTIEARGAKGYGTNGGRGARIIGTFNLTAGQQLKIVVGQQAPVPSGSYSNQYGGGGGSFVTLANNTPLIVAGGGGGSHSLSYTGLSDGLISTNGGNGATGPNNGAGGIGGAGGASASSADGGGGINGNGAGGGGGIAFINGANGGSNIGVGGFGGGGGTSSWNNRRGGGGGGYSGGGAAGSTTSGYPQGGGGGSFNNGTNQSNTAGFNTGNGQVIISGQGNAGCASALVPVTITINPSPTITVPGVTICSGQTATLTATTNMPGGTFTWSPGNLTGSSINVAPNATTQYTVSYTLAGCGTVTATATVTVNPSPAAPTANNVTLCGPGAATLTAIGGQNNNYVWYSNANGTGQLSTSASYTTPTLSTTTTYYVGTAAQGGAVNGTQTFNYTGGVQTFTAPVTGNYTVTLFGAQGGNGLNTTGGLGGQATGSLALTAGQTISVYVGGKGGNAGGVMGWNGGGQGGLDVGASQHGGSGGGATDIRVGGTGLANRVIVAGGGAGGGRDATTGVGGGTSGTTSANFSSGYGGTGGTQVGGGVAWTLTRGATNGVLGIGGNGSTGYNAAGGGGGGGGYYGGGGGTSTQNHGSGWSAGGGGGSSFLGGVTGGSTTQGVRSNDGLCTITWSINTIGCPSALTPVTVTVNPVPVVTVTNDTVCAGQQATLTATSTVPGGTFTWSPGGTTGSTLTVTPNTTTTYTATYTVAGCPAVTGTGTVTVNPLQQITGTLSACLGLTSQLANAVTPGTWSSSNTGVVTISATGLVTGVSAGTSTITYNASNGCSTTSQFTVYPQPVLTVTPSNVLCFGGSGSVTLSASGANAPYTYGGSPTQNLQPGTYTYTATSVDGCVSSPVSITITQPQAALALTTTQVNVLCSGNNTGSINLTVTGGTAPYTYAWSNNTTQEDPTNLAAGSYTVTVTDANGCTATTTVTITQPSTLTSSYTQVNVGCFGNNTGSIDLTVSGGVAPYVFAWSNQANTEDLANIASGTYTVTVTDANGCTTTQTVTITQPQAALALSTTQVNVLCFGNSTGSIDLTPTGGTSPYTYAWSNNTTQEDPTGLAAGSYTVTVTDANGCTAQTSVTITQPQAALALSTTQVNVLCFGNSTGSVNLSVTGGTAPYTYAWSNNTTQEDPTGLAAGSYTVTVTDANGCTAQTSVTITQPQAPLALSTTQVNVLCFGNSTGSVNLSVTGGTAPYTYAWSNNSTQEDPTGLAAGTYTVTVTDANGCTTTQTVTITQPQAALALSTTQVNVLCFGNSTGSIDLTPTGGTSPYTYAWSNNTTQEDPTGLAAGSYTVTVTDANGCTTTQTVTITQPQAALALSTTQVNVLCFGNSTGSVNLTVTGGTAPYTYAWSNNTTQEDPTGLAAGSYTVTVTDANGCTAQTSVTITQPQVPLALSTTQVNVLCFGNSTGSVNLTVTGGTAPYTYAWSNNTTQEDPTGLAAGTYTVTVTDANGCTSTTTVTITQPQAPLALSTTQVNVLCFGNSTGSVNLSVTGGTAPYTYAWSNNTTQEDPSGLAAGTYTVTVTDANGCTSTTTVTITQPQAPLALSTTQTNVLCFGNSTGSVNLSVTGGTAPYTYAWSNNTAQEDPTNLAAGTYTVTVTDANGCTATTSVTITQPQAGLTLSTTQTNVLCFGNNTGAVDLTVTGGTAPYSYLWSNNGTAEDPTGMLSGTYTVTVTDANGCTSTTTVTITQPQAPLALSTTQVNVGCFGNSTGSIDLTPTGGTAPYTYAWSNNTTQEDPSGLAAGTYTVTVTDANGCTTTQTVTITQPQAPLTLSTTQVNVLCFGNSTGSVNLSVTGGTSPYSYAWSNNTTQEDPTGLAAGSYTVTVTDANGCTAQTSVTITQPQAALALSTTQVNVLCFGNSTGSVNLSVTGGTAPYTYAWSNNTTQEDPTGLAAGSYTVTVTDANGCTAQTSVTITQPQAPLALSTTQVNVLCFGNSTGSVNLSVTGGTAPYTYAWSNNSTQEDPTGLAAGTYTVTVTDANGCTSTTTVTITQPQAPIALSTTQVNVGCFGNSTGSVNLSVTGGTAPYTYAWSNNSTQEDPTGLAAGSYTVTVTDANGCTTTQTVTITQPQAALALSTTQVNVLCFGNSTGSVNLTVTGGTAPYTYAWSNNTTQEDPTGLAAGSYTVTVTDANGCTAQTSVTITQPQAALALSTTQVNVLCFGNSTGSVNLSVTGGTAPYTYAWSNNTTQEDPSGLAAGSYTVTVTDANGCTTTQTVTITQPQAALALSTTQVNVLCFGNSTGSVNLTVTGGTAPYTYAWSNNTTQEDPTNLAAGTYTVTVTDANGCTSTTTVTITQPQAPLALSTTQTNVLCFGNSTGSVNLSVTGGTAPYTYAWSNNTAQEDPTNLAAGTYTVTVTDANGCTSTTTVTITQPQAPLALSTTQTNVLCFGNSTGSVNLSVTGGTAPYTYAWSNNTAQEDPTGLAAGSYTVTVTDANGCTAQTSVTITQPQAGLSLSTTQTNVGCFGNSTGSINLTVNGGTAPYNFAWSNNATQEDLNNLSAGTYSITVYDNGLCTAQLSVVITQPQAPLALSTTQVNVLCSGNNTGSINLTVTGGTAPYTYAWSNNTTQEDPTNLAAGSYTVTVTDANGCTATTTVTITQPSTLTSSYTQVNVGCFGNNTGSIDLTVSGGVAPYVFAWSNQANTEDLANIASGTYTVTVTDANGCTTTQTVTITQPQAALALSTTQVNVLCFGNSTGSIDLTPTGGTSPYTYAWSNNTTQEDPTGLAAGSYTVTVTDANGCTAQTSVTITQPQAALALSTTQVNVLCFGNSTGSVNLSVTGGMAPYTYAWSNNTTQEDPTGLAAGSYTVTVTDANGCTATTTVTITQPASAVSVTTQAQNILCLNGTGSVNSTPTGGVAPYTYSWTNNATTQNITNLQAGTYTVTVQDVNGCTANSNSTVFTTLSQLPVQILNLTGTTILTCTTPTIVLQATGGVTYNWSGGSTPLNDTNSITQPGLYTVNMVDPNGCPVTQTITLTQNITPPTPGITNITGTTIIDCNAPSIDLQATGGGTYQWNNNLGTSSNVNITQAGTYTVVVTAANGCQDSSTVAITVAPVPAVTVNDTTICSGQSVTLAPSYYPAGGQAIWTNGQLTPTINVSPATTTMYSVLYTWNGCTATGDITVTVNPTPTLSVTNPNICFGDTTTLTATPNVPNGTYNWITTNETTPSISVHPQSTTTYSVTYTLNGCTSTIATSTVTVTPLPIITVPNITICEGSTGTLTATATVAGGNYTWSQGGTTASITESPQATTNYNVSYTVNGCTSNTESATITVNPLPNVSFIADTTSGCVPVTVQFSADTTGQQAATYVWSSPGSSSSTGSSTQMVFSMGGCYDVTLTATLNGCSASVTQPDYICVQDYPQASFEANPPSFTESTQMLNFNNTSVGATGYVWNFGDGNVSNQEYPEHLFQGTNDGYTITLIASTTMGCMDSTSLFIDANLGAVYYIPNSFTPDGNQFNQIFKPVFTSGISPDEYEMIIYNRWGEIMFESHNMNVGWDGSYGTEGLDCPTGTYTYKIICTPIGILEQKQIITGHINLLR